MGIRSKTEDLKLEPIVSSEESVPVDPGILARIEDIRKAREERSVRERTDRTIRVSNTRSAASLSLMFPGLGQIYMKQTAIGAAFIVANSMLLVAYLFMGGIFALSFFDPVLPTSYDFRMLLLVPVVFALLSAVSIHMAFRLSPELKIAKLIAANKDNPYWVSFLIPGYGQLLNGQTIKSIIFSTMGILGVLSALSLYFTYSINWYDYVSGFGIEYVEKGVMILFSIAVASVFSYVVSVFDAYTVRKYPHLKRPLLKRLRKYFISEQQVKDLTPKRETNLGFVAVSLMFIFFMGFTLAGGSHRTFYAEKLDSTVATLKDRGMVMIPSYLERLTLPKRVKSFLDEMR